MHLRPHFSLDIKTKSSKGLILHVAGRGVVPLLALYVANGKIRMSLGQNRTIQHKQKSNDGNWHRVIKSLSSAPLCTLFLPIPNFLGNNDTHSNKRDLLTSRK